MKAKLIKGFILLVSKSVLASGIGFIALFIAIQVIGVNEYGRYAGAFAFFLFFETLLKFEIKLVLVKYDFRLNKNLFNTVFTTFLIVSVSIVSIFWLVTSVTLLVYNPYQEFTWPFLLLSLVLPISILTEIPRAILENSMQFKLIAKQEFVSALLQHFIVLLLVFIYKSLIALVIGWYIYNISISILSWKSVKLRPKFLIDREEISVIVHHSKHMFFQTILSESRRLVNPIIVGYFIGAEGVGIVSFTEKIVQGFSFFKNALQRVITPMIGATQKNKEQLFLSVREGTLLVLAPLGLIFLLGSLITYCVALWSEDIIWLWVKELFPFLAIGFFFYTTMSISKTALLMKNKLKEVTIFWIVFNSIFFLTSFISVKYYGIIGYGIAELAAIPTYLLLLRSVKKEVGNILSDNIKVLMICIPIAIMWSYIGFWSLFALPVIFLVPELYNSYKNILEELNISDEVS